MQGDGAFITWLLGGRFYSYRMAAQPDLQVILGESGANDPAFNLRREPLVIQRVEEAKETTFVSLLEPHGMSDGATEQTVDSQSLIASLRHRKHNGYDLVIVETKRGGKTVLAISNDTDPDKQHRANIDGRMVRWTGFAERIDLAGEKN